MELVMQKASTSSWMLGSSFLLVGWFFMSLALSFPPPVLFTQSLPAAVSATDSEAKRFTVELAALDPAYDRDLFVIAEFTSPVPSSEALVQALEVSITSSYAAARVPDPSSIESYEEFAKVCEFADYKTDSSQTVGVHHRSVHCTSQSCSPVAVFHHPTIKAECYLIQIVLNSELLDVSTASFTAGIVNPAFTSYELVVRGVFLFATYIVLAVYISKLIIFRLREIKASQLIVLGLLIAIIAIDNPLFPLGETPKDLVGDIIAILLFSFGLSYFLFFFAGIFTILRYEHAKDELCRRDAVSIQPPASDVGDMAISAVVLPSGAADAGGAGPPSVPTPHPVVPTEDLILLVSSGRKQYTWFILTTVVVPVILYILITIVGIVETLSDLDDPESLPVVERPIWYLSFIASIILIVFHGLTTLVLAAQSYQAVYLNPRLKFRWWMLFVTTMFLIFSSFITLFVDSYVLPRSFRLLGFFLAGLHLYAWTLAFLHQPSNKQFSDQLEFFAVSNHGTGYLDHDQVGPSGNSGAHHDQSDGDFPLEHADD